MDKILEALIEEITNRVVAKLTDNSSDMMSVLKVKVQADRIEGLTVEHIEGLDRYIDDALEEGIHKALKDATFTTQYDS